MWFKDILFRKIQRDLVHKFWQILDLYKTKVLNRDSIVIALFKS